jgi:two-component system, NarL family, response regulator NreC
VSLSGQNGETKKIRCVLAHDLVLMRQGLRRLLEDEPDMSIVAETADAAETLREVFTHRPDIVIIDAYIFECTSKQCETLILRESPMSKVLFLIGEREHDRHWQPHVDAEFAERRTSAEELVEMVRKTAAPQNIADASNYRTEVAEWPIDDLLPRRRVLTAREREVLKLLAEGRTVRSAATVLGLSFKTVDAHKFNLMRKLGVHNKAELVMWAIQKKIVRVPAHL